MIQFSKLRLSGFKSFVDRTELEIGPGLTGIVGPNGCGKSNLVEALRWSMGESSSKRMRGGSGSMDDVIFAGTEKRPARNVAEVSVLLDNTDRSAPGPYNNFDDIEVVRKIERDHGSGYRINGKNVRARDVNMLYADILSGANSPYLISQGKITDIIQAKPLDRRMLLEEAAGISGLYARRHEAELRLRATDNNLRRLEDLLGGMESRLADLKKQARQAAKYRNLSADIRKLEIEIAALEWRNAHDKLREVERQFAGIESDVAEHLTAVTQLTNTQTTQSADLPALRKTDAEMAAGLQAQKLALQRLEDEAQRLDQQINENQGQQEQLRTDRQHEQQALQDNEAILTRLDKEEQDITTHQGNEDSDLEKQESQCTSLQQQAEDQEKNYTGLMESAAADRARKQALEQQIAQDTSRRNALAERLESVKAQLAAKKEEQKAQSPVEPLRTALAQDEAQFETLNERVDGLERSLADARSALEARRKDAQKSENAFNKLDSEINALESIVQAISEGDFKPVLDDIRTDDGFETALSRALGDTLTASTDQEASMVWLNDEGTDHGALPALPDGIESLAPHIKAPQVLHRALSQIGFVENDAQARAALSRMKPGQALVSRDGAYWRWDGLHIKASAADRHAVHLKQKNKLAELVRQKPAQEKALAAARAAIEAAVTVRDETQDTLRTTQDERRALDTTIRDNRRALQKAIEDQAEQQAELAKLEEALSSAARDLLGLDESIAVNQKALSAFDETAMAAQQTRIDEARGALSATREKLQDALLQFDMTRQEQNRRKARLQAIRDERVNLQNRAIRARDRLKDFDSREQHLKDKGEKLKTRPAAIQADTQVLLDKITVKESEKTTISDKIAAIEGELAQTTQALKEAEGRLASARESRAHAQATATERRRHMDEIKAHVEEHFGMSPEELHAEAAFDPDALPALDDLRGEREKAVRSRDLIGPVNLRADVESEELEKELGTILNEKQDLIEAIDELRGGIQKLNKEARERLQIAFDQVNGYFREMFTRLFGGGKAHLALIESDDPLEAGLEIFAQPPGKALQSLSLLSGGEQTLTAIALIFAMFLTNPAPICVMDEVDAPLDDANVDRVCDLLEEFAERGETRFLIITHHRLTMARMDRLYGVTMAEKGVSQLVSVDLNQQLDFLEAA